MNSASIWLIAIDNKGEIVFDQQVPSRTFSISPQSDADICLEDLGSTYFVAPKGDGVLLTQEGADRKQHSLGFGESYKACRFQLLFLRGQRQNITINSGENSEHQQFLDEFMEWSQSPASAGKDVKRLVDDFLKKILAASKANNAFVIYYQSGEASIIGSSGTTVKDIEKIWQKIPKELNQEILKNNARTLLPQGLSGKIGDKTTLFVQEVRSVVGFPIISNGSVIAILYIGFNNLLAELSPQLHKNLQRAADLLALVIHNARLREELSEVALAAQTKGRAFRSELIIGSSKPTQELIKRIEKYAAANLPVLILGETGVGKELVAKELHLKAGRSAGPFVAVNCSAIPSELVESQLFGYKKGSFTGALGDHEGLIGKAHGGTLFMDEIGEIPASLQVKLLRVLQEKKIVRLGDTQERDVDFRLVSATHQDLQQLIAKGSFRQDLYYRIAGVTIEVPALRERGRDIQMLANYFRERFIRSNNLPEKVFSESTLHAIENHDWPGNVRELEHVVNRAVINADDDVIRVDDLGLPMPLSAKTRLSAGPSVHAAEQSTTLQANGGAGDAFDSLEAEEGSGSFDDAKASWMRAYIVKALKSNHGSRQETAKALGIGQRTLFRYLEQLGIKDS